MENEIIRQQWKNDLTDRAKELGIKTQFEKILRAYEKEDRKLKKEEQERLKAKMKAEARGSANNMTHFNSIKYKDLKCGNWIADENGVVTFGERGELQACYHPILPIERYTNIETGDEKIRLAFKKGAVWKEITCDKDVVASASKIISLANTGVSVTSENARYLVRYLADVENYNIFDIPEQVSTSKLGWIKDGDKLEFMPFYDGIKFDGDLKFKNMYDDLKECGEREEWYDFVKSVRRDGRIEPRIMMASSFASVLIMLCNALPFVVHLYGQSEGGKTLCLMFAASIWGNPSMESAFTGDFLSTQTAIEIRANTLNHLPYIMDDTAQVIEKYKGDFSSLIYTVCSGNGKDRSNKSLGLNYAYNWRCAFLITGETPITKEYGQAGASNRVLEVETGYSRIFEDGVETARILNQNYGFAGKDFIKVIKEIGVDQVQEIQKEALKEVEKLGKMKKQSISMSIILTADRIATDYLFKDGVYLDIEEISGILKSESDISENERCYDYIIGEIARNRQHFKNEKDNGFPLECWGTSDKEYTYIIKNVFDRMCRDCNYNSSAFLSWAKQRGLITAYSGRTTKKKRIDGVLTSVVGIKNDNSDKIDDDFHLIDDDSGQFEVPFYPNVPTCSQCSH